MTGEMIPDPAAVRAIRDPKFQRWLQSEISEAEIRLERAKDTVVEARRVLEEIKQNLPEALCVLTWSRRWLISVDCKVLRPET